MQVSHSVDLFEKAEKSRSGYFVFFYEHNECEKIPLVLNIPQLFSENLLCIFSMATLSYNQTVLIWESPR